MRGIGVVVAIAVSGCANVIGLSSLEEVDCVGAACTDGAVDVTVDSANDSSGDSADTSTNEDSGEDSFDASTDTGAPMDTATEDTGAIDSGVDTGFDAGCEAGLNTVNSCGVCGAKCDTTNSAGASCFGAATCQYTGCTPGFGDCDKVPPNSNGCESSLVTTANCGACGKSCDTTNSLGAACTGTSCVYTGCKPGFANCDTTAPDLDGCGCATATTAAQGVVNGCCGGTGCQTKHDTGVGVSFFDCNAPKTYNAAQALAACKAYTNDATGAFCKNLTCSGGGSNLVTCNQTGGGPCVCWTYSGTNVGHVYKTTGSACGCPTISDATWN